MAVDKDGSIYVCGAFYPMLSKYSAKGKQLFLIGDLQDYYGPYKIKLYDKKVRVYIEGYPGSEMDFYKKVHYLEYKKNGTFIGYH